MLDAQEQHAATCRTFLIQNTTPNAMGSLGGSPPDGVTPKVVTKLTRYFCTLPFKSDCASIFLTNDPTSPEGDLIDNVGKLFDAKWPIVQVEFHSAAKPAVVSELSSEPGPYSLTFDKELPDSTDDASIVVCNKIGGYPYFRDNNLSVEALALIENRWFHLCQFVFPDWRHTFEGSWPFGEYVFHVFTKEHAGAIDYKYCLG